MVAGREWIVKGIAPIVKGSTLASTIAGLSRSPGHVLTLCGPVGLTAGGERVALPAKCLALLAYLALEPGPHSRETVGALLWGDSPDDRAHGSLRQALTRLRTAVGNALVIERTVVALSPGFATDVANFCHLADTGDEQALEVDVPHFLEGLLLHDAEGFAEWADRTRAMLMRRWRTVLIDVARAAATRREWPRARLLGDRWQSLEPLSDQAAHFRVEACYLAGDRDGALSMWRTYRAARRTALGSEPSLALRELAARIESAPVGTSARPRIPTAGAPALPVFDAPLVGRAAEWQALLDAWGEASLGEPCVIIIEGEPGVGRSRLLEDFLRLSAMRGATVLRGRAFDAGRDVPYGATRDLLRGAIDAPGAAGTDAAWLAEIARVVPEMRRSFPGLRESSGDAAAGRSLLHEGVAQLLLAAADEAPLVVALDDVHWVDGDSCQLLQHLVRRLDSTPVLWCATLALGAVARDAPGARLARALGALPSARRLRLAPLSRDEVWELIRSLGRVRHPQGGARLATRVHDLTGGNVLYVVELLKTLFAQGWLAADPATNEWTFTAGGVDVLEAGEMFPSVREGIAERVAALPDEEHALLLTIAASGHGCEASLLSYVHGISRLRAAHTTDALAERHLVAEADGTYRCAHALIADVVLDSVGPSRRREVHRMIALALTEAAASVGRVANPGTVARHAEAGGETAMAHRYALLASERSAAQGTWDDALVWLDLAASCAATPSDTSVVNEAAALLLERAGWPSRTARLDASPAPPRSIGRADVDLSGTTELPVAETVSRQ